MEEFRNSPTIEQLVEWFGVKRAVEICLKGGGALVFIRKGMSKKEGNFLDTCFRQDEINKLQEYWGGLNIKIPRASDLCINYLSKVDGLSLFQIALTVRCSAGTVSRVLKAKPYVFVDDKVASSPQTRKCRHAR